MFAVVITRVVERGEGGCGDRRSTASFLTTAVADPAIGILAFVNVFLGTFDHFDADGDSRVAAASQSLDLSDRRRAFVKVVSVSRRNVSPTSGGRLGISTEFDGLGQHFDQFFTAIDQTFFAQDLRQEQHRETVAVGVPRIGLWITDQPIIAALADQKICRSGDLPCVRSLCRRAAAADQCRAGQCGKRGRIDLSVPLAARRLRPTEPIQSFADRVVPARIASRCARPPPRPIPAPAAVKIVA